LIYGIKKTILSDFNYLYQSSNSNDFKITINKNYNKNIFIYDSFYLFPNISEINTKTETNIINDKIVKEEYLLNSKPLKYNISESENELYSNYASVDYIVSKGIDKARVSGKGYGESKLVNKCKDGVKCSEDEHQQNRRTEFRIVKT
jgi:hypothetical protein